MRPIQFITFRKIFFLAVCLLVTVAASAQSFFSFSRSDFGIDDFYTFKFGFEVGGGFSTAVTSGNATFRASALSIIHAGATAIVPIYDPVSFEAEVLFTQKGYSANTQFGNFTERTQFIDIPLLIKYDVGNFVSAYLGPQLSFLTNTQDSYASNFNVAQIPYTANSGRKNAFGGVIGLSADLNPNIDIHIRYTIDLQKTYQNGFSNLSPYQNQVYEIGVGVKFF